jgi:TonB family protein
MFGLSIFLAATVSQALPTVAWRVDSSGRVVSCTVVSTSGDPKIDKKACDSIRKARPKESGQATVDVEAAK